MPAGPLNEFGSETYETERSRYSAHLSFLHVLKRKDNGE